MSMAPHSPVVRALLFGMLLLPRALFAQVPQAFEFQGAARDAAGNPRSSQAIQLRLGILSGGPSGTLVYQETQTTTTSPLGLFSVRVGNGNPVAGSFANVAWDTASHFLSVELDPLGGTNYQLMGTTHLLSVPYALFAGSTPCYTVSMAGDTLHEGPDCYVIVPGLSAANGGCSDADSDGYFSLAGCGTPVDCNDGNAAIHPGMTEVCDGIDNDCSGAADEGFNLLTDPQNCGTCGNVCSFSHATSLCVNGVCQLGLCDAGFGNCDGNPGNGCETDLSTSPVNCNACGNVCSFPNASSICVAGVCQLGTCNPGFGNCDGNPANGCETNLSSAVAHCGACGNSCDDGLACTSDYCVNGSCTHATLGGNCVIAGVCYANGTLRPGFPCQRCNTATSTTNWSNVANGTVCVAGSCSNGTVTFASTCQNGSCSSQGSASCSPYTCDGTGTACRTSCSVNSHCAPGYVCVGSVCKKANGQACTNAAECASGFCSDGYCCESACNGVCEGCAQTGRLGFCDPIPAGTDPANECPGTCNGARACGP